MIVKLCAQNSNYPDLTPQQPYAVIGIEADDYRILNDQGRPFLYPSADLELMDAREPADWVTEYGADGERYAYPPPLNEPGFFEDFFEDKAAAVTTFWRVINQELTAMPSAV